MVVTSNSVQTQGNISKSQLYQSKKRRHELAITKKKSSQTLKPAVFFIASLSSSFPDLVFSETKVVTTQHWSLLNIGHYSTLVTCVTLYLSLSLINQTLVMNYLGKLSTQFTLMICKYQQLKKLLSVIVRVMISVDNM